MVWVVARFENYEGLIWGDARQGSRTGLWQHCRGMKIGLGAFMSGWQSSNYELTTVEARAVESSQPLG